MCGLRKQNEKKFSTMKRVNILVKVFSKNVNVIVVFSEVGEGRYKIFVCFKSGVDIFVRKFESGST